MKKEKKVNINCLAPFLFNIRTIRGACRPLFAVYMVLLVWIILFKLQFSIHELDTVRNINLIPFHYENEIGMNFHLKEVLENIGIFIPFGIYLCMLKYGPNLKRKFLLIFFTSLILEIFQYILAVGGTDITDLITNTCGGMIGIGLYWSAAKIFRGKKRADTVITVVAAIVTVVVVSGVSVLLISN